LQHPQHRRLHNELLQRRFHLYRRFDQKMLSMQRLFHHFQNLKVAQRALRLHCLFHQFHQFHKLLMCL
jgi:hypothetical protein